MAQGNRMQRLISLVQMALADLIRKETTDPRFLMVTVVSVGLARDLSSAKVFVSTWDETQAADTVAALNQHAKHFRYELARAVKLRIVPELKFVYDDSSVRGHRISSLINAVLKDNDE